MVNVEEHIDLAYWAARRWQLSLLSLEDRVSVCMEALVEARDRFDPDRGCRFSTFYASTAKGKLLQAERKQKNTPLPQPIDHDFKHPRHYDPEPEFEHLEAFDRMLEDIACPRDRMIIEHRFRDGETLAQIGKRFGLCAERVRQLIDKSLDELRVHYRAA